MGQYLNTPGAIKLFLPYENVQTPYTSLTQIPIMTLDKQVTTIPSQSINQTLFVHFQNILDQNLLQKLNSLKNVRVYYIPDQQSKLTFKDLKQKMPFAFGKMIMNGPNMHPLVKYLKKNCYDFYDFDMLGSKKIQTNFGIFFTNAKGFTTYYTQKNIDNIIKKIQGQNGDRNI